MSRFGQWIDAGSRQLRIEKREGGEGVRSWKIRLLRLAVGEAGGAVVSCRPKPCTNSGL
jgi:hypothetical protein